MFSPFLRKPFEQAIEDGAVAADLSTLAGTWGAVHDTGELTYMNLVHLDRIDGTDPDDLTRGEIEGRRQAMHAIEALRRYTPGCERARLRNFGMTLGIRDTRKIDAVYNMTERDVREQGRFDDSIGIYPEFIDGYGVLSCRRLVATSSSRTAISCRRVCATCWSPAAHRRRPSRRMPRRVTCRAARSLGQGAGIAAALSMHSGADLDSRRHLGDSERTRPPGRALRMIVA